MFQSIPIKLNTVALENSLYISHKTLIEDLTKDNTELDKSQLKYPIAAVIRSPQDIVTAVTSSYAWLVNEGCRLVDTGVTSMTMLDLSSVLVLGIPVWS